MLATFSVGHSDVRKLLVMSYSRGKLTLGINAFHGDASACLLIDEKLVAAVEEERFNRVKHWAGFPKLAVAHCLRQAQVKLSDIDVVAINSDPRANFSKKLFHAFRTQPPLNVISERLKNISARNNLEEIFEAEFPGDRFTGKIERVEHHLAHLSSAFHVSPFQEASILSVDGFGDFASGAWGMGSGAQITVEGRVHYPHSLGAFYQAITQFIGFPNYGDEYKVMGLAPYGRPVFLEQMREIVRLEDEGNYSLNLDYFRFHREKIKYEWRSGSPVVGDLFSDSLSGLFGTRRKVGAELNQTHKDIAASAQAMFEEALWHKLNCIRDAHQLDSLCLAGGCGNNSVANGKISEMTGFKHVYVPASSGDAGGAIGAAYSSFYVDKERDVAQSFMSHAYYGPSYTNAEVKEVIDCNKPALSAEGISIREYSDIDEMTQLVAENIAKGHVVGWFQGGMEWGPRALGNRSILGDVRRSDMKDILNLKIKRRESFRPFAPSILRERVSDWFERDDDVPFMMKVFKFRAHKRDLVPAVAHVDGSGRLQTVQAETNLRYYKLIQAFEKLTGVPIILNTSFNENEPIVCIPQEAVDCFLRTKMDVLVINDFVLCREVSEG